MPDSSAKVLSAPIRAFLRQHIPSLHQLEILLGVYAPPGAWNAEALARHLYLPPELVEERLADLASRGLIRADPSAAPPTYRADEAQAAFMEQLATCYRQHRVTMTTFIFTQPNDVVQSFADAFKWRKES